MKTVPTASAVVLLAALTASPTATAQITLPVITVVPDKDASLTMPDTEQATRDIQRIPGAVEVVSDGAFKNGPAQTVKDVLGWVPGVFAQSRFGDDARISIRGSGLSRNYGNRGLNMYRDGIPINTSDGYNASGTGWSGYIEGRNLLDRRYIANAAIAGSANAASELYNPGAGRSIYAGLQYSW